VDGLLGIQWSPSTGLRTVGRVSVGAHNTPPTLVSLPRTILKSTNLLPIAKYALENTAKRRKKGSFEQFCYNSSMTRGKALVEDDVLLIAYLLGFGCSTHDIGKKLGMPQRTVSYRMAKFEVKPNYKSHVQKKKIEDNKEKD
jgi:hypothetical protein